MGYIASQHSRWEHLAMTQSNPSFLRRLSLAFAILSQPALASRVERLREAGAEPPPPPPPAPPAPALREAPHEAALQLLGLLQREARFVDFVQEDVAGYSDADIGAARSEEHTSELQSPLNLVC